MFRLSSQGILSNWSRSGEHSFDPQFTKGTVFSNSLALTVLVCLCFFVRFPFYFRSVIDWDESTFILMGQNILDGHLPYIELWENKPPLAFAFFALAILFGKSIVTVRVAGTVAVLACAYLTCRIGDYVWGRQAGLLAAILSIVFISLAEAGQATMTEIIALVPTLGALTVLLTRGVNRSSCFWAGLLLSVATLIRLNLAYLAAAVAILIVCWSFSGGWAAFLKRTTAYVLGGLLPLAVVALPYIIGGHGETLMNSVFMAPLQHSGSLYSPTRALSILIRTGVYSSDVVLWTGCLGGIAAIATNWSTYDKTQKYGTFLIAIFCLGVGCSIVLSGGAHPHYLIQLIPFFSLIAGTLHGSLLNFPYKKTLLAVSLIGLVALAKPIVKQYVFLGKKLAANEPLLSDAGYQIASYLRSENPAGEPLYMMTDHIVHWLTGTQPIAKSVTHPSTIGKEHLLKAFLGPHASSEGEMIALLQKRPLYIVKNRETSYLRGAAAKILADRLSNDYVLIRVIGGRYIYRRWQSPSVSLPRS